MRTNKPNKHLRQMTTKTMADTDTTTGIPTVGSAAKPVVNATAMYNQRICQQLIRRHS